MDDILDDLERIARRLERAAKLFEDEPLHSMLARIDKATTEVGKASSGSWTGYHASLYLEGFRSPGPWEHFNSEWGLQPGYSNTTTGTWASFTYVEVESEILRRAGIPSLDPLKEAADHAGRAFRECKESLEPLLDALIERCTTEALKQLKDKLDKLDESADAREWIRPYAPRTLATRDPRAQAEMIKGAQPPHHLAFQAIRMHLHSYGIQAAELAKVSRHLKRYLEASFKMKGKTIAKKDGKIFIGHGRSLAWRDLKDFLVEKLELEYDEFNREEPAGKSTAQRLEEMLDTACLAFLVMTAEDEHPDGTKHARENVIHEAGLFQGRLGFQRAIILLEEGCSEFSNKAGLTHIPFPKGNIKAVSERIRDVLRREGIM